MKHMTATLFTIGIFMFSVVGFCGFQEDVTKLQQDLMQKRRTVKSQDEMTQLRETYQQACREILARYDLAGLDEQGKKTAAAMLIETQQYQKSLDLILPFADRKDASDGDLALAAASYLGLDNIDTGLSYLDRMNREEATFQQACMQQAMMRIQADDPGGALQFLERLRATRSLVGQPRIQVLTMMTMALRETGQFKRGSEILEDEARSSQVPQRSREELGRMSRRLRLVGSKAKNLHGVSEWLNSDPVDFSDGNGTPVVAVFYRGDLVKNSQILQLVRSVANEYEKDAVKVVYVTITNDPTRTSTLGTGAPKVPAQELEQIKADIESVGISSPVAVLTDVTSWRNYHVSEMPEVVLIDGKGIIQGVYWPPIQPVQLERALRKLPAPASN